MPTNTPASGALPSAREPFGTYKICLVCLGNICRSPMAEVVLREVGMEAVLLVPQGAGDLHRQHGYGDGLPAPSRTQLGT